MPLWYISYPRANRSASRIEPHGRDAVTAADQFRDDGPNRNEMAGVFGAEDREMRDGRSCP